MGLAVVTVASGGLPIVESTVGGTPVTEATNGRGVPVTKVVGKPGMPVVFETIGVVAPPVVYATLDPATITAVTLSGGNLIATNTGTSSTSQGAHVVSTSGKIAGKIYFEATFTNIIGAGGANQGVGIGTVASTYAGMGVSATTGIMMFKGGPIYSSGTNTGITFSLRSNGDIIGIAINLDNRRGWYRVAPSGNWNNNVANNPETNIGGVVVPAGTMIPFLTFGDTGGQVGNITTINFGASAFVGAVPAGFTSGWPA